MSLKKTKQNLAYKWIPHLKRQQVPERINKQNEWMLLKRILLHFWNHNKQKVKEWNKVSHVNWIQKKTGIVLFLSNKIYFKSEAIQTDQEDYFIIISFNTLRRNSAFTQHSLEVLARKLGNRKKDTAFKLERRNSNCHCADGIVLYLENPKRFHQRVVKTNKQTQQKC